MKKSLALQRDTDCEGLALHRLMTFETLILSFVLAVSNLASSSTAPKPQTPTLVGPTQLAAASLDRANAEAQSPKDIPSRVP